MLNIPALFKEIEKENKCQSVILELWTPPEQNINQTIEKEINWADESIKYLKEIIM
jgi:hypothetical protein